MTADVHVDPYGSRRDPQTGLNLIELDRLATLRWIGEQARGFDCEALVVAGDYVESKVVPPVDRGDRIIEALLSGPDRQIHLRGNHDIERGGRGIMASLARMPGWVGHARSDVTMVGDLAVCAIPHLSPAWYRTQPGKEALPDREAFDELSREYLTIARGLFVKAEKAGARSAILVGHQQLSGGRMTEKQQVFLGDMDIVVDTQALSAIGYVAVVFGHVHRAQTLIEGQCPVAFAGSSERTDFAEENDPTSFLVVDVVDGKASLERIPTPARRWLTLTGDGSFNEAAVEDSIVRGVDLDPDVDEADLRRALYAAGALEVMGMRRRPAAAVAVVGGLSEDLAPEQLLEAYFADDPDRDELVAMGRRILAEVAA